MAGDDAKRIGERIRIVNIMAAMFLAGTVVITALPFTGKLVAPLKPETPQAVYILLIFGLISLLLGHYVPILAQRAINSPQRDAASKFEIFFKSNIIALSLREGAAILGLVAFQFSGDPQWSLLLGGAAIAAMLFGWPKTAALRAQL